MNPAHLHLMVNHLPVVGMVIVAFLLLYARFVSRSQESIKIALFALALIGLSGIPAYLSGEAAEDVLEGRAGFSENLIEEHEEVASLAFALTQVSALIGLLALIVQRRDPEKTLLLLNVALISVGVSIGVLGYTAQSGGMINHPEIRSGDAAVITLPSNGLEGADEDERNEYNEGYDD